MYILAGLVLLGFIFPYTPWGSFLRIELPEISFIPETLTYIPIAKIEIPLSSYLPVPFDISLDFLHLSNTLLTSWLVMALIISMCFLATRRMSLVPSGVQNLLEVAIESLLNLVQSVAGEERGKKFFPVVATIFLYVLVSNWLGLLPGFGTIGIKELHSVEGHPEEALVPIFRSPSTDLNMTLSLALISVTLTQIYGAQALGIREYFSRFINIQRIIRFFVPPKGGKRGGVGQLVQGGLDFFIGGIELISEIAKILSFSLRLLGNIFAGEVLLLIMAFFAPFFLPIIFFGFETFVGFIQAFVFAVLTLMFMTLATTSHETAEHH